MSRVKRGVRRGVPLKSGLLGVLWVGVNGNLIFTMKIKLPNKLLKYFPKPTDLKVEFCLFIEWRLFLRRMRNPDLTIEEKIKYVETVLGGIFNIPMKHWREFIPRPVKQKRLRLSPKEIQRLLELTLQPKTKKTQTPKVQKAPLSMIQRKFKPKLIVRRDGQEIKRI